MITRAHRISNGRCTRRNKETLPCNMVRYLSSSSAMCSKVARVRERDISDSKQVKMITDKKVFCREVNKKKMHEKVHPESYSNVKRGNQKKRVLLAVYDRITRAKSKKILETQMRCSNEGVAVPCIKKHGMVGKGINAMDGKRSMRPSKGPTAQVKENICQSQFEVGQNKQERTVEVRMTRAKKNQLLQIQAEEENAVSVCLCEHTSRDRCPLKIDSNNKSFLMHNYLLQRKRKRMSADMFCNELAEDSCIPETDLQSKPSLKIRGNDVPEQECRCRAITRSAMHRENANAMIKDQTICGDVQSNSDQNQSGEVEVTDKEQKGFTDFAQLRKKLNSSEGRESEENGSNANACIARQIESRMQSNQNHAGFIDSQYFTRNLRHRKCSVDTNIMNSVQVFHDCLNAELRERDMEGSTGAKVLSTTAMPARVTRSMSKTSCCVEKLEQKWVGMKHIVPHKIGQKEEDSTASAIIADGIKKNLSSSTEECMKEKVGRGRADIEDEDRMGLNSTEEADLNNFGSSDDKYRSASGCNNTASAIIADGIKKNLSSSTEECMKEKVGKGRADIEDEDRMGLNSTEEAGLNNFGSSDDKYRSASGCNNISALSNEGGTKNAGQDSKLSDSEEVIEDGEGKGHTHRNLRRTKTQNYDIRKEYLTRSKQEKIEIQGDLARCAASEIALINEGHLKNRHQKSKLCGSNKVLEDSEGKGHLCEISKWKKKQSCGIQKEYWTRSKHEDIGIQGDMARQSVLEKGTELEIGSKGCFGVHSETFRQEINDRDNVEYGCQESKPSGSSKAAEDPEVKGHSCRNSKQKKKQISIAPGKGYQTRSKLEDRNTQGDMARCSASEMDVSGSLCDKGSLNHRAETTAIATMELMVCSPLASEDKSNVLAEFNSVGSPMGSSQQKSVGKSTGEFQGMNMDGGSCLNLELEQLEADSIGQDTSVPDQTKDSVLRTQTSMLSHGQCNDLTHENQRRLVEDVESKGIQRQNLCLGSFDGQSAFPQCTNNSKVTNIKAEVTLDPNYDCSRRKPGNSGTSNDCHHDHWSDLKRKRIVTTFLPNNNSEQGRQMRPRPLDPQQPLPIFIEGRDQEFNEHDGVSSSCVLKLQESDNLNKFHVAAAAGRKVVSTRIPSHFHMKKEDIKIPSYRTVLGYREEHGCQSGGWPYALPQSYIRHMETTSKSQMDVAEYDMEDDDQEWLQKFNEGVAESKMASKLTEDEFEKLIEYFEKESAQVSAKNHTQMPLNDVLKISKDKNRPSLKLKLESMPMSRSGKQVPECSWQGGNSILSRTSHTPQMSDCCICNGGENSASNPVYRCKSCFIYVHQSCYGVYESRNGGQPCSLDRSSWCCRNCEVFGSANVDVCCAICLKYGGALKPTTDPAKWAHVVCALYTNETFFVNTDSMEPIDGISSVEVRSRRQKRLCWFCGSRLGSCERCSVYGCGVTFHVSCGVNRGAYFELQHNNQQVVRVRSFCPRHASAVAVASIGVGSTCLKEKDITYEKGVVKEDGYSSDLCRLSKILQSGQEGPFTLSDIDDRQVERPGAEVGFIKEESSMKDPCHSHSNCHFSIPKRQRRQISEGRIQSADGKDICKPLSQNRMLVIDPCNNNDLSHEKGDIGSLLYSTDTDGNPQGSQLSDGTINRNVNVELVGGSILGNDGNQLLKLDQVLKANVGPASVVSEVYSYWLSKRMKKKGPLLQKFQQEQTAKRHDIFNQDFSGLRAYFGLKVDSSNIISGYDLIDIEMVIQKLMGLQRELESLRSIAKRIMVRERVKAQLLSVLQKISEMKLFVVQKNLGLMSCFSCKSSQNVLRCVRCRRIFCFECYKLWNGCGMKSYRILSSRGCICRDCGASKSEYLNNEMENIFMKSEMVNRGVFSTEVSKGLITCPSSNLACDSVTAKPHGKGRKKESELKKEPSSACVTKTVHSMLECVDSRTDSLNVNMQGMHENCDVQETHETCSLAGTNPLEEIDGHPLERGGKQRSACKTVLLSELTDIVGLSPGSLPFKNASRPCRNNVPRNKCKGKKVKTSDSIPVSS